MGVIEKILAVQLEKGIFDKEAEKVSGFAKLALDKGFDTLTGLQKRVLEPFLTHQCAGVINPGDHHNDCQLELEGDELLDAYAFCEDPEFLQCAGCREEDDHYGNEWARIQAE